MSSLSIISPDAGDACAIYRINPYKKCLPPNSLKIYDGKKGFLFHEAVMESEIILLQRPHTQQQLGMAQTVKRMGRKLIVDWDDDLSCVPLWNPNAKHFKDCVNNLKPICALADVVTVTTPALAAQAKSWGAKEVVIVPNAIDDCFKHLYKNPAPRTNSILWRGSNTHSADLEVGRQLITDLGQSNRIVFVGDCPPWAHTLKDVQHYEVVDYANFLCLMHTIAPKMVVVPLADHPFNHAKSDVGAQEAYLIGAQLWHNNVGVFKGLPATGEPRWLSKVNSIRAEIIKRLS